MILGLFSSAYASDRSIYKRDYGTEKKIALVIGNSEYSNFKSLKNSLNDAKDIKSVLETQGFEVLSLYNGSLIEIESIIQKFENKLKQGGVGFFYYAGHGLEVNGQNYLVPSSANISAQNEVKYKSYPVGMLIAKMQDSHNRLNILVLDACRDNPFGDGRSIGGEGLAPINNAEGMYIAFATAPKKKASDGDGRNGLFTKYLLSNIQKENLKLDEVFSQTRASVYKESDKKQLPWTSSSVIGDFYFSLSSSSDTTPKTNEKITTDIPKPQNHDREIKKFFYDLIESVNNRDTRKMMMSFDKRVSYYGKSFSSKEVERDKVSYMNKWNDLNYKIVDIDISNTDEESIKRVDIVMDFDMENSKKRVYGQSSSKYKIDIDKMKIIYEKSKVLDSTKYNKR